MSAGRVNTELAPTVLRAARQAPTTSPDTRPTVLRAGRFRPVAIDTPPVAEDTPIGSPRAIGNSSPEELLAADPELAAHVRRAGEEAIRAAHRDGLEQGRAEQAARLQQLEQALANTVESLRQLTVQHRDVFADDVVSLAEAIATTVIDRTPHDGGAALLERLRDELAAQGPVPVTVKVHPDDVPVVAAASTNDLVSVEMDPRLVPGDLVVESEWSTVERTREAAWALVRAAIDDD